MKARELFERTETIGVCFGRFNPPHKGHAQAWKDASQCNHWYVGTNENTNDKKNPLPYNVKVKCMEAVYPEITGHIVPSKRIFELATSVYDKHGDNNVLKVYTDEDWIVPNLERYNGKDSAHGYYKFERIEHIPTSRVSSATSLREAASTGDRSKFTVAAGIDADTPIKINNTSVNFFDIVAKFLKEYKS